MKLPTGARGVLAIVGGAAGGQALNLLMLPVLSRLFSVDQFGQLSALMAIVGLVIPMACLRLEAAVMLPRSDEEVRNVSALAITSLCIIATLFGVAVWLGAEWNLLGLDDIRFAPLWAVLLLVSGSLFGLASQLALRNKRYGLVASRNLIQAIGINGSQVALAFVPFVSSGLILGTVIGRSMGIATVLRSSRNFWGWPRLSGMKLALRRYRQFPLIFTPSHVLNALGVHAPLLIVSAYFGISAAGQFGMADRLLAAPLMLIGVSVGQVLQAELATRMREGRLLEPMFLRSSALLAGLGALVCLAALTLGRWIVPAVMGSNWQIAGQFLQAMAITAGIRLVANPISSVFALLEAGRLNLGLDVLRVLLIVVAVAVVRATGADVLTAVWLIYGALALTYLVTWFAAFYLVRSWQPGKRSES